MPGSLMKAEIRAGGGTAQPKDGNQVIIFVEFNSISIDHKQVIDRYNFVALVSASCIRMLEGYNGRIILEWHIE